jgi:hypothetical protein
MKRTIHSVTVLAAAIVGLFVVTAIAAPGVVADSESDFSVTIDTADGVAAGDNLNVTVTVTNDGSEADTQDIVLEDGDGTEFDRANISLDSGESTTLTLTWSDVSRDKRTITPQVFSDDDADSTVVTVRWSYFGVDTVSPEEKTLVAGDSFDVSTTIRNTGTIDGQQNITLRLAGTEEAIREDVAIEAEGSTDIVFSDVQAALSPGTYDYTIETANESVSGTLTVLEAVDFVVNDIQGSYEDGTATISAVVSNTDEISGEQAVTLRVNGGEVESQQVSLQPGEETNVTFTYQPESLPLNVTVGSALDTDSMELGGVTIESMDGSYESDTAVVETVVTNQGDGPTDQTITFEVDDTLVEEQTVSLAAGEQQTVTFTHDPSSLPINVTASTAIDTASVRIGEANIEEGPEVNDVGPYVVAANDSVTVTYTADGPNLASAELRVYGPDGSLVFSDQVSPGTGTQYTFDQSDLERYQEGTYDVTLWVEDEFGGTDTATMQDAFEARSVADPGPLVGNIEPDTLDLEEPLTIRYTAEGENFEEAILRIEAPSGTVVVERPIPMGINQQASVDPDSFAAIEEGNYDVTIELVDVFGNTVSDTLEDAFTATSVIDIGPSIDSVSPEEPTADSTITVDYAARGTNLENLTLSVVGPSGDVVLERSVSPGIDQQISFQPSDLTAFDEGTYDVILTVTDSFGNTQSAIQEDAFEAGSLFETGPTIESVAPETVQVDDTLNITYSAEGTNLETVRLQILDPQGAVVFEQQVPEGTQQGIEVNPRNVEGIEEGPYAIRLVMTDVFGTSEQTTRENAFEMAPRYNPENGNFAGTLSSTDGVSTKYEGTAGDFVMVSVSLNEISDGYVIIGGNRAVDGYQSGAPLDILHVSGSATFMINTRLVGTDRPSQEVYIPIEGSVTSYAHSIGATAPPAGVFEGLSFETEGYEQAAATLQGYRNAVNSSDQARPLQPSEISMVLAGGDSLIVTEEGLPDARYPLDRGTIKLTEPQLGNITTYRLPTGNADERSFALDPSNIQELTPSDIQGLVGTATQAETITRTDRLLIEVQATGMYGALVDSIGGVNRITSNSPALIDPSEFRRLLDRPEGINLEMVHTNPPPNVQRTTVDLFDSPLHEVSIIASPPFGTSPLETNTFYILVDTREPEPFNPEIEPGDEYEIRMQYVPPEDEQYDFSDTQPGGLPDPFNPDQPVDQPGIFPYLLPGETVEERTATVTFEERFVEYNRTTPDGRPVVPTAATQISGVTNLAPGNALPIRIVIDVRDTSTTVELNDISIGPDGSFQANTDLSMLEPGAEVDIQFWAYQELLDERELKVVSEDEVGGEFEVSELNAESVVTVNGTSVETSATVTNTGLLEESQTIELVLENEVVANETISLGPGESRTLNFNGALDGLDPGQYPLEVRTDDGFEGMILVVDEATNLFEVSELDATSRVEDEQPVLDFVTTIRNTGTLNGTESIELLIDGEVVGQRNINLAAGEDETYTFDREVAGLDPGNYTLTVRTPHDEATINATLEEPKPFFAVTNVSVRQSLDPDGAIEPVIRITNTGTLRDSGTVTTRLNGDVLDESLVDLEPGQNGTVRVAPAAMDLAPGEYTLSIETDDDERTIELVVESSEESEDGEDTGDESDESSGDESDGTDGEGDDSPDGVALPAGRRAAVGGTAIVAAVHILGYWI